MIRKWKTYWREEEKLKKNVIIWINQKILTGYIPLLFVYINVYMYILSVIDLFLFLNLLFCCCFVGQTFSSSWTQTFWHLFSHAGALFSIAAIKIMRAPARLARESSTVIISSSFRFSFYMVVGTKIFKKTVNFTNKKGQQGRITKWISTRQLVSFCLNFSRYYQVRGFIYLSYVSFFSVADWTRSNGFPSLLPSL